MSDYQALCSLLIDFIYSFILGKLDHLFLRGCFHHQFYFRRRKSKISLSLKQSIFCLGAHPSTHVYTLNIIHISH